MHLTAIAPAKVNLCLLVGPRDNTGYHELFTVFAPISLYDELEFSLSLGPASSAPGAIHVECPGLLGEENLAVRALREVERVSNRSIQGEMVIRKNIPLGAGLGGGSSDAAVALKAAARLVRQEGDAALADGVLHALARGLGADVPFFLEGKTAAARGIGDRLELIDLPRLNLVLMMPERHLATAGVYATFDRMSPPEAAAAFSSRSTQTEMEWRRTASAWAERTLDEDGFAGAVACLLRNDLERASFSLVPELIESKKAIEEEGALGALMSGSGPSLFGVCGSKFEAEGLATRLEKRGYHVRAVTAG